MDYKKFAVVFLILVLILVSVSADSITNYEVPSQVHLNQRVTATGIFNADSNDNIECHFYFIDANSGALVSRATDQYTDGTGRFTMPKFIIFEPDFKRENTYTLKTTCGSAEADANFDVLQFEGIGFYGQQNFDYITQQENIDTIIIWAIMILIIVALILMVIWLKRYGSGH